jgi:hypothetical protein
MKRSLIVVMLAAACSRGDARSGTQALADAQHSGSGGANPVPTATRPGDSCGWLPAAEVEQIVGPLSGPPIPAGRECRYPLKLTDSARAEMLAQRKATIELAGKPMLGTNPDSAAVVVSVDLGDGMAMIAERAGGLVGNMLSRLLTSGGTDTVSESVAASDSSEKVPGWDAAGPAMGWTGFDGRIGHVAITAYVEERIGIVSQDKLQAVATRLRDRLQDLPFPPEHANFDDLVPEGVQEPDPCGLLTRAEAESVLGTLVVAPYRAPAELPFVHARGRGCAYYTPGHHVLVLTPHWSDAKTDMGLLTGIGGLVGAVIQDREAESADTLEGGWDQAAVDMTGGLALRKGDRMLQIAYLTSSTDAAGAVRLARLAIERLKAAR